MATTVHEATKLDFVSLHEAQDSDVIHYLGMDGVVSDTLPEAFAAPYTSCDQCTIHAGQLAKTILEYSIIRTGMTRGDVAAKIGPEIARAHVGHVFDISPVSRSLAPSVAKVRSELMPKQYDAEPIAA